jgi:hypothetical protein
MAVSDDLNKLAALDVVYLTRTLSGSGGGMPVSQASTQVFRGRLRQALNGDWVFNASTGQNGVVGFVLGGVNPSWTSSESPSAGIQVTMMFQMIQPGPALPLILNEVIVVTSLIPPDFTE